MANGRAEWPSHSDGLGDTWSIGAHAVVCAFLRQHPRITMSVLLLDRIANLVEEGSILRSASVCCRIQIWSRKRSEPFEGYWLRARTISAAGGSETPADLRLHSIIAFTGLMPNREWRFLDGKKGNSVSFVPRLEINDAAASIAAAEMGDGITVALSYMVADQIRDGRLAPLLDNFTPPPVPVHLVYPQSRLISPKLRAFIDFAAPRLRATLDSLNVS